MANTGLTRTNGTPTLATKCTISAWVKRCGTAIGNSGKDEVLAETYSDDSNFCFLRFDGNDKINAYALGIGSFSVTTDAVFRDPSAWYHVVLAIDTTESTSTDRVKIYVNGVQQTTSGSQPSQDSNAAFNTSGDTFQIGDSNRYASHEFDGIMSHYHFIDGTAYTPSTFGETDSTTGEWKIKTNVSATYGTNGFFILKDSNSVTDQSGNGNNLTVANGTLTNTEDCPSNVFATLNPLHKGNTLTGFTFANGNNTFTAGSTSYPYTFSTLANSSGKYYAEFKTTANANQIGIGISAGVKAAYIGHNQYDYAYYGLNGNIITNQTSNTTYGTGLSTNDILGVAMDLDNNKLYFSVNGSWQNSANPSSGTGGFSITAPSSTTTGVYHFALGDEASSTPSVQCNFGNGFFGTTAISSEGTNASGIGKFEYDVPTGYTALSTKGLNE